MGNHLRTLLRQSCNFFIAFAKYLRKILLIASPHREFAAAVELVVEAVFADNLLAALLESALAPVSVPPEHLRSNVSVNFCARPLPGSVYLVNVLPAGGGEGRAYDLEAVFTGILCGVQEPHPEAFRAAAAPLRLALQPFHAGEPAGVFIIRINNLQAQRLCIAAAFVLAYKIFLLRIYIRVAVIYDRLYTAAQQALDYGRRAGRTAGVQQNARLPEGSLNC